ncbi:class I SAM-dependent methyltransferase [Nocardia inohanensis]|uniref:class I SAM-dependent methyltransferase n=1 Tax=Nocardia inohanensis TaxID=209246 RepID=UPI001FE1CF96|nr:class I SAM-dependent methyltransferase [Nocardia inohanensis]
MSAARAASAARTSRISSRLCAAARCRFAEDRLADAISDGIGQVVLIGDGLENFAAHNPYRGVRVFEVPGAAELENALSGAGFDAAAAGFFVRLDGSASLTDPALTAALRYVGGCAAGSAVIFDHAAETVPHAACELLNLAGLAVIEDLTPSVLASRYLAVPAARELPGPRITHARTRSGWSGHRRELPGGDTLVIRALTS